MAASASLALKAGESFRRARLLMVSPDSRAYRARRQAETPLSVLCRFPGPALNHICRVEGKNIRRECEDHILQRRESALAGARYCISLQFFALASIGRREVFQARDRRLCPPPTR